jgi:hypothetical protein
MGYTPSLVAGVWVGNNNNDEMKRGADGSVIAAPIWQSFMREAVKDSPVENFTSPEPAPTDLKPVLLGKDWQTMVKVDVVSGKLASEFTPPEYIEERPSYVAHDTLYYVDKDDPRGPAPENPAGDPQFQNWENAVIDWVNRTQWNATSTAPTEVDDVHLPQHQPQVSVSYPWENLDINSRQFTIKVSASGPRRLISITAKINGYVLGTTGGSNSEIEATVPNALSKGSHDLVVEARDDVGNVGRASVRVNLLADQVPTLVSVTDPGPGATMKLADFPKNVTVSVSDLTDISRVDLYMQRSNGSEQLVGSEIGPTQSPFTFTWASITVPGDYFLYAVTTNKNGATTRGDKTSVNVTY